MDARNIIEEHQVQIALSNAVSSYTMQLAIFMDNNPKNLTGIALAEQLKTALSDVQAILTRGFVFTLSQNPDEKIQIIADNRISIFTAESKLRDAQSTFARAASEQQQKGVIDKLRSPNPYRKLKVIVDDIMKNPDVITGFKRNNLEIQIANTNAVINKP